MQKTGIVKLSETRDVVEDLHKFLEFSKLLNECLDEAM